MVAPLSCHEPSGPPSVKVALLLTSVPNRFTVPPVRFRLPNRAVVNVPPRFTVELLALIVPPLPQLPLRLNVPLVTVSTPLLACTNGVRLPHPVQSEPGSANTTWPLPPKVCVPAKLKNADQVLQAVRWSVTVLLLSVSPLSTVNPSDEQLMPLGCTSALAP